MMFKRSFAVDSNCVKLCREKFAIGSCPSSLIDGGDGLEFCFLVNCMKRTKPVLDQYFIYKCRSY